MKKIQKSDIVRYIDSLHKNERSAFFDWFETKYSERLSDALKNNDQMLGDVWTKIIDIKGSSKIKKIINIQDTFEELEESFSKKKRSHVGTIIMNDDSMIDSFCVRMMDFFDIESVNVQELMRDFKIMPDEEYDIYNLCATLKNIYGKLLSKDKILVFTHMDELIVKNKDFGRSLEEFFCDERMKDYRNKDDEYFIEADKIFFLHKNSQKCIEKLYGGKYHIHNDKYLDYFSDLSSIGGSDESLGKASDLGE